MEARPPDRCRWDLLTPGEVLLRFDPGEGRIARARSFRVCEGGGEYNVARALRRSFGLRTAIVTALVDNPVGRLVEDLMLAGGADLSQVIWCSFDGVGRAARNDMYFLERGFGVRGGVGTMDRGATAIGQMRLGEVDWDALFGREGVRRFHTGGVLCALSESTTELAREAITAARRHGTPVSFDCNYRPSLWAARGGRGGAIAVNRKLLPLVDVLFGHEGDLHEAAGGTGPPQHTLASFSAMAERVLADFPHLRALATAVRQPRTATRNGWGGFAYADGEACEGLSFPDLEILDRVGGGDAFAAGFPYGSMMDRGVRWALNCGVAAGALAMTTSGDAL